MSVLYEVFLKRIETTCNEVAKEEWYNKIHDEMIKTRKLICEHDNSLQHLLEQYDSLCLELHTKTNEIIYAKAYKDGTSDAIKLTPNLTPKQ